MKYIVMVTETSKGYIEVEANTPVEAEALAEELFYAGDTVWREGDVSFIVL